MPPPGSRPKSDSDADSNRMHGDHGHLSDSSKGGKQSLTGTGRPDIPVFPILRGESVGRAGEFIGHVILVCSPDDLNQKWDRNDTILVLSKDLENYLATDPRQQERLFRSVQAIVAEFGESIGEFASAAQDNDVICIVKTQQATRVVENGMHLRIVTYENIGDIFFID